MKKIWVVTCMASMLMAQGAYAFTLDTTTGVNKDGSSRFSDPDDQIPFPHVSDDGQMTNQFQSGAGVGVTNSNSSDNAFQRAQERMQQ